MALNHVFVNQATDTESAGFLVPADGIVSVIVQRGSNFGGASVIVLIAGEDVQSSYGCACSMSAVETPDGWQVRNVSAKSGMFVRIAIKNCSGSTSLSIDLVN